MKSYLMEKSLIEFIQERLDQDIITNKTVPESGVRFRPDIRSEKFNLILEFDGAQHYTVAKNVINDLKKDKIYSSMGYDIIRIPYFVQLDKRTITTLFSDYPLTSFEIYNTYPHGFIDKNATLPADYCVLGIVKFWQQISTTFSYIREEILDSLEQRKLELEDENLVYPLGINENTTFS